MGESCLKINLPRLYSLSIPKEALVKEVVGVKGSTMTLLFRGSIFVGEREQLEELMQLIQGVTLVPSREDAMQ